MLGGILYKIRIFTCSISWHILKTRTQTDPQVRNWTRPVLRADGESAHETSGIHQAEDIDEDGVNWKQLGGRSFRQPQKPKPKMKLRAGCEVKEDQKMNRSHHRSTPGAYTALSNGHLDIGNWERPRRSASVFGVISCMCKFMQFYMFFRVARAINK